MSQIRRSIERSLNERRILKVLQSGAPVSRRQIAESTGISYPTVSKIIAELVQAELVEAQDEDYAGIGRPKKIYVLAGESRSVIGLAIRSSECKLTLGGLDGNSREETLVRFRTPKRYNAFLEVLVEQVAALKAEHDATILGIGVTVPSMINQETGRILKCSNLQYLEGQALQADIAQRTGLETKVVQVMHGLYWAERTFGAVREHEDFIIMNISGGLGVAICSGGRLLEGVHGMAGEFGHMTVDRDGRPCGCGNRGCLETLACDTAVANRVSEVIGREMLIEEIVSNAENQPPEVVEILHEAVDYLAIAIAGLINLMNPQTIVIYGDFLQAAPGLRERLQRQTADRALSPMHDDCEIVYETGLHQERETKGAIAAIVHELTTAQRAGHDLATF